MKVNVGDYRNKMSAVRQSLTSLKSALPNEREREKQWVRNTLTELKAAECSTAKTRDILLAESLTREAEEALQAAH